MVKSYLAEDYNMPYPELFKFSEVISPKYLCGPAF